MHRQFPGQRNNTDKSGFTSIRKTLIHEIEIEPWARPFTFYISFIVLHGDFFFWFFFIFFRSNALCGHNESTYWYLLRFFTFHLKINFHSQLYHFGLWNEWLKKRKKQAKQYRDFRCIITIEHSFFSFYLIFFFRKI